LVDELCIWYIFLNHLPKFHGFALLLGNGVIFLMMVRISLLILVIALGCKSIEVQSFYNESVDFGQFYTYKIINPLHRGDDFSEKGYEATENIENSIAQEMELKQYRYGARADLVVSYQIILDDKIEYRVNDYYSPYSYRYSGYPYDPYYSVSKKHFKEGVFMIEIKDQRNRKLFWQGSLDLKINKKYLKDSKSIISETVSLILKDYPFVAGKSESLVTNDK